MASLDRSSVRQSLCQQLKQGFSDLNRKMMAARESLISYDHRERPEEQLPRLDREISAEIQTLASVAARLERACAEDMTPEELRLVSKAAAAAATASVQDGESAALRRWRLDIPAYDWVRNRSRLGKAFSEMLRSVGLAMSRASASLPLPPSTKARVDKAPDRERAMLLLAKKMPVSEVAREIGVHPSTVYRWRKKLFEKAGLGKPPSRPRGSKSKDGDLEAYMLPEL